MRNPDCQSSNHPHCKDRVWTCDRCRKRVCELEGSTDKPGLCDACWFLAKVELERDAALAQARKGALEVLQAAIPVHDLFREGDVKLSAVVARLREDHRQLQAVLAGRIPERMRHRLEEMEEVHAAAQAHLRDHDDSALGVCAHQNRGELLELLRGLLGPDPPRAAE